MIPAGAETTGAAAAPAATREPALQAAAPVKKVLLIAFHYPPVKISSGIQRSLKFSTYLSDYGWQTRVLTVHPRAFESTSPDQLREIPDSVPVDRAFGLDTARHLAVGGRYPGFLALPDRWSSWLLGGLVTGLGIIRRWRPDVIMSTYPIATAHLIGLALNRLTGVPWVADFRDSMTEDDYPPDPRQRRVFRWIERNTVRRCAAAVFTTPSALDMYARRYPELPAERWVQIENGFDEDNFAALGAGAADPPLPTAQRPLRLVHSGIIYPSERDPTRFFDALAALKRRGSIAASGLRIVLRATGHDPVFAPMLAERGIDDLVELAPPIAYSDALREMLQADALLLFQAASCNHQIPAKVYEYFRAGRPVFAMTDAAGDTARTLRAAGLDTIVALDDAGAIEAGLEGFLREVREDRASTVSAGDAAAYSRRGRTAQLAGLLDRVRR